MPIHLLREKFEKWAKTKGHTFPLNRNISGNYTDLDTSRVWEAYQKAVEDWVNYGK